MLKQSMKISIGLILSFLLFCNISFAKGNAGAEATYESRVIIDMPSAGVLPKNTFAINSVIGDGGGMSLELSAAIFQDFLMGLSFSGGEIVGSGEPDFQKYPGIHLRYRVFNETTYVPAFTIGVQTQGRGLYKDTLSLKRFQTLSPGIFLASSKAFTWWGGLILLHGGVNFSFEPDSDDRSPNLYFGLEQTLGKRTALLFEYNANIDDNDKSFAKKKGLVSVALRWAASENLTLELQVRDLFDSQKQYREMTRFIGLDYVLGY
jgi:hypothetical protein